MISQTAATPQTTSDSKLRSWLISVGWALGSIAGFALVAPSPQSTPRETENADLDWGRLGATTGTEMEAMPV